MDFFKTYLINEGINSDNETLLKFEQYFNLLIDWNNKFNLTAITDKTEVYIKHFIDSLSCIKLLHPGDNVVDIGSGAGFPAIPLAIVCPDISFVLVDSLNKRVTFLNQIINTLSLTNCTAVHSRAEDFALLNKSHFSVAVARAVASLNTLLEYLIPLLTIGGRAIAFKASGVDTELAAASHCLSILHCEVSNRLDFNLFNSDICRVLLEFTKISNCSPIYPRGGNRPKTQPL